MPHNYTLSPRPPSRGLLITLPQPKYPCMEVPAQEHAGMTDGEPAGMTEWVHAWVTVDIDAWMTGLLFG